MQLNAAVAFSTPATFLLRALALSDNLLLLMWFFNYPLREILGEYTLLLLCLCGHVRHNSEIKYSLELTNFVVVEVHHVNQYHYVIVR